MNDRIRAALAKGHLIDITTTGRTTGLARRLELVFHNMDGRLIISGSPRSRRKRGWLVNLESNPQFTFHLKGPAAADLPATARVITDEAERRTVAEWITTHAWQSLDVEAMVADSPMIEVTIDDLAA